MSFTRELHSGIRMRRLTTLGAVIAMSIVALSAVGAVGAYEGSPQVVTQAASPAQEGSSPEANLPFLFAVYIITWAAFFAYVFYVSRRQRELRNEIQDLKRALEERDKRTDIQ